MAKGKALYKVRVGDDIINIKKKLLLNETILQFSDFVTKNIICTVNVTTFASTVALGTRMCRWHASWVVSVAFGWQLLCFVNVVQQTCVTVQITYLTNPTLL